MPVIGFAILLYVVINANIAAQALGVIWLVIGVVVLVGLVLASARRPALSGSWRAAATPAVPAPAGGRHRDRTVTSCLPAHGRDELRLHLRRPGAGAPASGPATILELYTEDCFGGLVPRRRRPAVAGLRVPVPQPGHRAVPRGGRRARRHPRAALRLHHPGPGLGGVLDVPALRGADRRRTPRPCCSRRWRSGSGVYDIDVAGRHRPLPRPATRDFTRRAAARPDARHRRRRARRVRGADDDRARRARRQHGHPGAARRRHRVLRRQRGGRAVRARRRARPAGPRRGVRRRRSRPR